MTKKIILNSLVTLLLFIVGVTSAATDSAQLLAVTLHQEEGTLEVDFKVDQSVHFRRFLLDNPQRLVIDFDKTSLHADLKRVHLAGTPFTSLRSGHPKPKTLRLVFDANQPLSILSHSQNNNKVTLRLKVASNHHQPVANKVATIIPRNLVVLIDPGHGGKDPGATGPHGTREKDVVLQISKQLKKLIEAEPGMQPVMTRDSNYYLTLRERLNKARSSKADVFVAIHADAFKHARARGASVYVLSMKGASSEAARWLAEKENYSELGGVSLNGKNDILRSVLIDLSQTATITSSLSLGEEVLQQIGHVGKLHHNKVEQAPFMVLKSPDIPSILVETGFLSNPQEEHKLKDPLYQRQLARAILNGLREYFYQNPLPNTWIAQHVKDIGEYKVVSGDSLSSIAQYHHVSLSALRRENNLASNTIRIGQILKIPKRKG